VAGELIVGDPGQVFKDKAAQALGPIGGLAAVPFTPIELNEVGWVMAQALSLIWGCHKPNIGAAINRAMNPTRLDQVRLFVLVKRSGYPRSPFELAERLKHLSVATAIEEFNYLFSMTQ